MRLQNTVLTIATVGLLATTAGHARDNRLRVEVSPRISTAPATIRVRAIVEPNAQNRGIEVTVDSGDFYRRSFVPLDGIDAALVTETTLKNLPGGQYEISVVLVEAEGHQIVERSTITVSGAK